MAKFGVTKAYRYYADRFYLDRANRDTYLARQAAGDVLLSGNLVLPALATVDGVDLSVHADDLDAHMADFYQTLRTGQYYGGIDSDESAAIVADTLYAVPFFVARTTTWDRIGIEVTTAGAAGKLARIGIYNNGTNLYPGTLLLDAEAVAVDPGAVPALAVATISQQLTKGVYWLAIVSNGTPTIRCRSRDVGILGFATDSWRYPLAGWSVAQAYGALPNPFTAGGSLFGVTTTDFQIGLRLLSLD